MSFYWDRNSVWQNEDNKIWNSVCLLCFPLVKMTNLKLISHCFQWLGPTDLEHGVMDLQATCPRLLRFPTCMVDIISTDFTVKHWYRKLPILIAIVFCITYIPKNKFSSFLNAISFVNLVKTWNWNQLVIMTVAQKTIKFTLREIKR